MTYSKTIDYLYQNLPMFHRVGSVAFKKDLTNTIALCDVLGNPQAKFPTIHIGGTNGKGSTAHMTAAILQSLGLKVGLYVSPHYRDFRERIKINGDYMSKKAVVQFVEKNRTHFERIEPSFFEMTVAMAFDYFATEGVDVAVIEVGLGGRLDSTNVISPMISVITNISLDHTDMLGDTLPLIAFEKAGIIKSETPVVIGEEHGETKPVFEQKAIEMAQKQGYDYVICGHIHTPQYKTVGEVTYLNSGDWVENLTALEYSYGTWSIYHYDNIDYDFINPKLQVTKEPEFEEDEQQMAASKAHLTDSTKKKPTRKY